jgi:hypothetical protein
MAYRKQYSRHSVWQDICNENQSLLDGLPKEMWRTEKNFRSFVTHGIFVDNQGQTLLRMQELTDKDIKHIRSFIDAAQFDMDAIRFDAFNEAFYRIMNRTLHVQSAIFPQVGGFTKRFFPNIADLIGKQIQIGQSTQVRRVCKRFCRSISQRVVT